AFAQVEDLFFLALAPGLGPLAALAQPALLVLLPLAARLLHPLLAVGLLDRLGVLEAHPLGRQRDPKALQLAPPADLLGRVPAGPRRRAARSPAGSSPRGRPRPWSLPESGRRVPGA